MMKKTVLTGDLIQSSSISIADKDRVVSGLKTIYKEICASKPGCSKLDIYRGDGFQFVMDGTADVLHTCLMLKAGLLSYTYQGGKPGYRPNARLAAGLGTINSLKEPIGESDGEAFRLSGRLLEQMKNLKVTLLIAGNHREANMVLEYMCAMIAPVADAWTQAQAEVVYELLQGRTQEEISKKLRISQPSVSQRARAASWHLVEKNLAFYTAYMKLKHL